MKQSLEFGIYNNSIGKVSGIDHEQGKNLEKEMKKSWCRRFSPINIIDAICLSNICELMDDQDTFTLLNEVLRKANPGPASFFEISWFQEPYRHLTDKSFVRTKQKGANSGWPTDHSYTVKQRFIIF